MTTPHANTETAPTPAATQSVKYNKGRPVKILLDATQAFCKFDRPGQSDIRQYKEFFYSLVEQSTPIERREISIALARNNYTPRTVAIYLALGEVSGSTPILLFSPVLKEVDLLAIAEKCTLAGVRVLARRDGLSLRVMKAIDAREDRMASRILQADKHMAVKPKPRHQPNTAALPKAMVKPDVSAPIAQNDTLLALASRGGRLGKTQPEVSTVFSTPTEGISGDLIMAARNRDRDGFCKIVGKTASLNPVFVSTLLSESNPETLCSLLKALHIESSAASQILLLLNQEIGTSVQLFRSIMAKYDLLVMQKCREEMSLMGAQFKGGNHNSVSGIGKVAVAPQNNSSKLENALRTRQEALGHSMNPPSFGNRARKQYSAA